MLTGEVRNKVDKIWTDIWAGGITNLKDINSLLPIILSLKMKSIPIINAE